MSYHTVTVINCDRCGNEYADDNPDHGLPAQDFEGLVMEAEYNGWRADDGGRWLVCDECVAEEAEEAEAAARLRRLARAYDDRLLVEVETRDGEEYHGHEVAFMDDRVARLTYGDTEDEEADNAVCVSLADIVKVDIVF